MMLIKCHDHTYKPVKVFVSLDAFGLPYAREDLISWPETIQKPHKSHQHSRQFDEAEACSVCEKMAGWGNVEGNGNVKTFKWKGIFHLVFPKDFQQTFSSSGRNLISNPFSPFVELTFSELHVLAMFYQRGDLKNGISSRSYIDLLDISLGPSGRKYPEHLQKEPSKRFHS